jgi:hypothetical protein
MTMSRLVAILPEGISVGEQEKINEDYSALTLAKALVTSKNIDPNDITRDKFQTDKVYDEFIEWLVTARY